MGLVATAGSGVPGGQASQSPDEDGVTKGMRNGLYALVAFILISGLFSTWNSILNPYLLGIGFSSLAFVEYLLVSTYPTGRLEWTMYCFLLMLASWLALLFIFLGEDGDYLIWTLLTALPPLLIVTLLVTLFPLIAIWHQRRMATSAGGHSGEGNHRKTWHILLAQERVLRASLFTSLVGCLFGTALWVALSAWLGVPICVAPIIIAWFLLSAVMTKSEETFLPRAFRGLLVASIYSIVLMLFWSAGGEGVIGLPGVVVLPFALIGMYAIFGRFSQQGPMR